MRDQRVLNLKVGIFISILIVLFVVSIFALGGESRFFKKRYAVQTSFTNTAGLLEGAPVRLSGVRIGIVSDIRFPEDPDDNFIIVTMEVKEEGIRRIGADAVATIRTEGLLGDKYIEILPGTKGADEEIPAVTHITSYTPPELEKILGQSEELVENIINISQGLDTIVKGIGQEENLKNISSTIASIKRIAEGIETRESILHTLIYGEKEAKDIKDTLTGINSLTTSLSKKDLFGKLDKTLENLNLTLEEIKGGEGLLAQLIYEEENARLIKDLRETASNLRDISEKIKRGEGTLGALVNDPSLYEEVNTLLGGAQRSKFIRTTIRYLIEKSNEDMAKKNK